MIWVTNQGATMTNEWDEELDEELLTFEAQEKADREVDDYLLEIILNKNEHKKTST